MKFYRIMRLFAGVVLYRTIETWRNVKPQEMWDLLCLRPNPAHRLFDLVSAYAVIVLLPPVLIRSTDCDLYDDEFFSSPPEENSCLPRLNLSRFPNSLGTHHAD
jgi:hypothetical protein